MFWVNEKRIGDELHTLYRNAKGELVTVVYDLDKRGRKVKDKKTKKPKAKGKEKKVTKADWLMLK